MVQGPGEVVCLEQALLDNWPALEVRRDDGWVWRFAHGYTGRANSLSFLDPGDGADAERRLADHAGRFRKRGVSPCVRVTPLAPAPVLAVLDAQGWRCSGDTRVLVKDLEEREPESVGLEVERLAPGSGEWVGQVVALGILSAEHARIYRAMMERLPRGAAGFVVRDDGGRVAACALASVSNGIGGVFGLQVVPAMRRRGLGRKMIQHVMKRMREEGARSVALQVVGSNRQALDLYRSLGFEQVYAYHYRMLQEGGR